MGLFVLFLNNYLQIYSYLKKHNLKQQRLKQQGLWMKGWSEEVTASFSGPLPCQGFPNRIMSSSKQSCGGLRFPFYSYKEAWDLERWHVLHVTCPTSKRRNPRLLEWIASALVICPQGSPSPDKPCCLCLLLPPPHHPVRSDLQLPEETAPGLTCQDLQPSLSSKWEVKIIENRPPAFGSFFKQIIKRTHARAFRKSRPTSDKTDSKVPLPAAQRALIKTHWEDVSV